MKCPFCGYDNTSVKDSRATDDNSIIRRRRFCAECQGRFTTVEHVQLLTLSVIKKNGRVEPFSREKLEQSLRIALHKRDVASQRFDKIASGIIRRLEVLGESQISSRAIGEEVLLTLKNLDKVAYVRFASVYRNFDEAEDFEKLVHTIDTREMGRAGNNNQATQKQRPAGTKTEKQAQMS